VYQWSDVDVFEFFGWDDQIVYKVGAEFRPSDKLALRAGFNYGESPIKGGTILPATGMDAAFANYPFPAVSETHVTLGLGYQRTRTWRSMPTTSTRRKIRKRPPPYVRDQMEQNAFVSASITRPSKIWGC